MNDHSISPTFKNFHRVNPTSIFKNLRSAALLFSMGLSVAHASSLGQDFSNSVNQNPDSQSIYEEPAFGISRYQHKKPAFGIELATSFNALGEQALTPSQGTNPAYAFHLAVEYQPTFIQKYGIVSFGPSIATYPILGERVTPSYFSIWSFGGQIRYQARYFHEQPVVPMVGYSFDSLAYNFSDGTYGRVLLQGPVFGAWVLLNFLDRASANQFHIEQGVLRTYLVAEARSLTGNSGKLSIDRYSYYVGLRFEL